MASVTDVRGGFRKRLAFVDLTARTVSIETGDSARYRDYVGGRGFQARLLLDHLLRIGPLREPLNPENRLIIGTAALNDTAVPTAGRGSCSFVSPFTRSPVTVPWVPSHEPVYGLVTHSSIGGVFPNMLKRAGVDHVIIDGRADRPVRLLVTGGTITIVDAEDDLFEVVGGERVVRKAGEITEILTSRHSGSATVCLGPAGWRQVAFAGLTGDRHRNFGRGGAGAVFGSKNLVAVTAQGRQPTPVADAEAFDRLNRSLSDLIASRVADPSRTVSFRPETGTTWWLDRAFDGRYLGQQGGYLPWHNFDEGHFDPSIQARVGTEAFLEISGRHHVCSRCRHIVCTRLAEVESGPHAGRGVRPEFETIGLWINCGVVDRDAIFHLNQLANDLGVDTMTLGSVMSAAMELHERGLLGRYEQPPAFGSADDMMRTLEAIAYRSSPLGRVLGRPADEIIAELSGPGLAPVSDVARCVTMAYAGLGYAAVQPKVFPGMFLAYATSSRGRGDHTYAWTIQAEEAGLADTAALAEYVATAQTAKALVDSLGLCDFFPEDITSPLFLDVYRAATGVDYSPEELQRCGQRICAIECWANNLQGRSRRYDAYVPAKLTEPLVSGPHAGKAVNIARHEAALDAYYERWGWSADGRVPPERLAELGISGQ